jgi:hypothetical protein
MSDGPEWTFEEFGSIEHEDDSIALTMTWQGISLLVTPAEYWDFAIDETATGEHVCAPFSWDENFVIIWADGDDAIQVRVPLSKSFAEVMLKWHTSAEQTRQRLEIRGSRRKTH